MATVKTAYRAPAAPSPARSRSASPRGRRGSRGLGPRKCKERYAAERKRYSAAELTAVNAQRGRPGWRGGADSTCAIRRRCDLERALSDFVKSKSLRRERVGSRGRGQGRDLRSRTLRCAGATLPPSKTTGRPGPAPGRHRYRIDLGQDLLTASTTGRVSRCRAAPLRRARRCARFSRARAAWSHARAPALALRRCRRPRRRPPSHPARAATRPRASLRPDISQTRRVADRFDAAISLQARQRARWCADLIQRRRA